MSFSLAYLFAPIKRKDDDREDGGIQRIEATKWKKEERLDFEIELYENNLASKIAKQKRYISLVTLKLASIKYFRVYTWIRSFFCCIQQFNGFVEYYIYIYIFVERYKICWRIFFFSVFFFKLFKFEKKEIRCMILLNACFFRHFVIYWNRLKDRRFLFFFSCFLLYYANKLLF